MRTIVDLPEKQVQALARVCERENISRAEAVRRAVAGWVAAATPPPSAAAGFGLWRHKKLKARKYVDRLRAEWER
jgi:hypothetical protein